MSDDPSDVDFADLDLNLLKVFVAILKEGSLTRAGETLDKSVAAVSQALTRLRHALDDPLFETEGRRMRPTPRALEIAPIVREGLDTLKRGLGHRTFVPTSSSRTFTIDLPVGSDCIFMPRLIANSARTAPGIRFQVQSDRAATLRNELRYGETEIALDFHEVDGEGMRVDLLYNDPFFLVSRKDHPSLSSGKPLTRELFSSLDHVGLGWARARGESPLHSRLARGSIERHCQLIVPTLGAIPPILELSNLVALMSERVAGYCVKRWNLQMHPLPFDMDPIPMYLVWHQRFDHDAGHAWLRGALKEACSTF